MTIHTRRLLAAVLAFGFSASAWSYDLAGEWSLKVENPSHHLVTTLTIEFTNKSAHSCLGGNWKSVNIVYATTEDTHFYPVSDSLSYNIENNQITIGRNEICDAYLMLSGAFSGETIRGEYYSFGLGGSSTLGFFTLSRKK